MDRRKLAWWGAGGVILAAALGTAIVFGFSEPPGLDVWWSEAISGVRSDWMLSLALVLNEVGGGWIAILVVPLLAILALLLARRWRSALFAAACFIASAGAVQLLKEIFGRARPNDMLVASDYGSFPSGHVANAATIAAVVWVLFPRVWTAIAGAVWVLLMALSRTFLSVHWLSDTVGGALVGAGVVLLLAGWLLPWMLPQRTRDSPPVG